MARNSAQFLAKQITIIRPKLLITLGKEAYMTLRFTHEDFELALCKPQRSSDFLLLTYFGFHFFLLPWPHPSGLNRWNNVPGNRERLKSSFAFVAQLMETHHEK
jgi:uracil-DNA glycosylase